MRLVLKMAVFAAAVSLLVLGRLASAENSTENGSVGTAAIARAREALGVTHVDGKYCLTQKPFLLEGADTVAELGVQVIKLYLTLSSDGSSLRKYPFHTDWPDCQTLEELADSRPFREVFQRPFRVFVLTVYRPGVSAGYWLNGISRDQERDEQDAVYRLASYLLRKYRGSGKTFVFQNWEGDWAVRGHFDRSKPPASEALQAMTRWLAARQRGVEQAVRENPDSDVRLYHAVEVNLLRPTMEAGMPCVLTHVVPRVRPDLVSYSAWDTQSDPALLRRSLDFIAEHAPDSPVFGEKNVYVGEFGLPENEHSPQEVARLIRDVVATGVDWGCPWVIYWQVYCNEARRLPVRGPDDLRGFWLIRPDGSRARAWEVLNGILHAATP
ncbi:MAG: hypothetical protein ACUVTW_05290 [Thermogutta sp.]